MSRGVNRVVLSGRIVGKPVFDTTGSRAAAGSFYVQSDRYTHDSIITVRAKINVYGEGLVGVCKIKIGSDTYVVVDGEMMNREGQYGESLLEIRAQSLVFLDIAAEETRNAGQQR